MAKDPAFPLYTQDFLVGTMYMSDTEVGVYIRLLAFQHQYGGLIDKEIFNERTEKYPRVREKFIEVEEGFFNERLMKEMVKREKKSTNLSANAKIRWENAKSMQSSCKSNAIASDLHTHLQMPIETENEKVERGIVKGESSPESSTEPEKYFEAHFYQMLPTEYLETWKQYVDHQFASGVKIHQYNVTSHLKAFKECWQNGISPPELLVAFQQSSHKGIYFIAKDLIDEKEKEKSNGTNKSNINKASVQSRLNYQYDEDKARDRLAELEEQLNKGN